MKRRTAVFAVIMLCCMLAAGCGRPAAGSAAPAAAPTAPPVSQNVPTEAETETEPPVTEQKNATAVTPAEEIVDDSGDYIDLTVVSEDAAFAELYAIAFDPDQFVGKTVKLSGEFTSVYDEFVNRTFYGCAILDSTACCRQGLDFDPAPEFVSAVQALSIGDAITVEGVFDTYVEKGVTFYRLMNAKLL